MPYNNDCPAAQPAPRPLPTTTIGGRVFRWGERTFIMGIVNATPDSFSGDGIGCDADAAAALALRFQADGADIIDIGGESTRPPSLYAGAKAISADEETRRVIPVIRAVAAAVDIPVSVDTYKAKVADAALNAGAAMVNDIWGFRRDADMARVVADWGAAAVLTHNQAHTRYADLVPDVIDELRRMRDDAVGAGVKPERIALDPGIGFGKTSEQSLELLRRLGEFRALNAPIMAGVSRKSVIGDALGLPVEERLEGTAAAVALSVACGADIARVHDVRHMARAARMSDAIVRGWRRGDAQ